jgi:hypothetical protein
MLRLSLGQSNRRVALSVDNLLFDEDHFCVPRRCARATDKGYPAALLSVALKCVRYLGKVLMECSLVAADNNVHVDSNQRISSSRHHVSQRRNNERRKDERLEERHDKEGLEQIKSSHVCACF